MGGEAPKVIAFYLPQFHPIPENDANWGEGFTEWVGLSRAKPNFEGHYQPRVPADLGYYDLRNPIVMDRQAELAKSYGIHGFCYYYYYFSGKRVLETPLERLLETWRPAIPFCLAWANENWTRTWDGEAETVILEHHYSEEQDRAVIEDLIRYFRHSFYIRVDGRPILLIYRARCIPDALVTTSIWRQACRDAGIGEIYLVMMEAADLAWAGEDPARYGFDAAAEFPPHNPGASVPAPQPILNPDFGGVVFDYDMIVEKYAAASLPAYRRLRSVTLGWDNTARRQDNAAIFTNATPDSYQIWLEAALEDVQVANPGPERLVFVNAWNEWGEGAYLEPDLRYGHAYLKATLDAIKAHQARYRISTEADPTHSLTGVNLCDAWPSFCHAGIHYLDFMSQVSAICAPKSYFEIGTNTGASLRKWSCDAVCVDPDFMIDTDVVGSKQRLFAYQTSSDDFFARFDLLQHFPQGVDIAFLDGLHLCEFLLRDFMNTERACHGQSLVLMHDCLPLNARMAERVYRVGDPGEGPLWAGWTGDVWRVLFALKKYRPDLSVSCLDCPPTGLVVIHNLNPKSDILQKSYHEALSYMMSLELDMKTLDELWRLYPLLPSRILATRPDLFPWSSLSGDPVESKNPEFVQRGVTWARDRFLLSPASGNTKKAPNQA